jgi:hypothetical protein
MAGREELGPPIFSYLELDGPPRISVVAGDWKLIQRRVGGAVTSVKLYRLSTDPGETTDLSGELPILAAYLGTLITARLEGRDSSTLVAPKVDFDEELEESLRALGYL